MIISCAKTEYNSLFSWFISLEYIYLPYIVPSTHTYSFIPLSVLLIERDRKIDRIDR